MPKRVQRSRRAGHGFAEQLDLGHSEQAPVLSGSEDDSDNEGRTASEGANAAAKLPFRQVTRLMHPVQVIDSRLRFENGCFLSWQQGLTHIWCEELRLMPNTCWQACHVGLGTLR